MNDRQLRHVVDGMGGVADGVTREDGFDRDRHFAFLRALGKRMVLVVCNFAGEDAEMTVTIPAEAMAYLGFEGGGMRQHLKVPARDAVTLTLFF